MIQEAISSTSECQRSAMENITYKHTRKNTCTLTHAHTKTSFYSMALKLN